MIFEISPTIFVALGSSSKLYKFAAVLVGIFNRPPLLDILSGTLQFVKKSSHHRLQKQIRSGANLDVFLVAVVEHWVGGGSSIGNE